MRNLALVFVAVFMYVPSLQAQDQRLELPTYHLTVDRADLSALYLSPHSNVRYPAQFSFAGEVLECEVRFRGGMSSAGTQRKAGRSGLRIQPIRLESESSTSKRNTRISR